MVVGKNEKAQNWSVSGDCKDDFVKKKERNREVKFG